MRSTHRRALAALVVLAGAAALAPTAFGSPSLGFTPTTIVDAGLEERVRLNSDGVKLMTHAPTDVRVQQIVLGANSYSGWHHHPGVVIVAVQSGSVTWWDSDCHGTTYGPTSPNGSVFTEGGDEPGQATSTTGATVYVTYIAPSATPPVFRVEDDPPPCA